MSVATTKVDMFGHGGESPSGRSDAELLAAKEWGDKVEAAVGTFGPLGRKREGDPSLANEWRYQAFKQEDAARKAMEDYRNRVRGGEASAARMQGRLDMGDAQRQALQMQGSSRANPLAMRAAGYGAAQTQGQALSTAMKRRAAEIAATEGAYQQALGRYSGLESDILKRAQAYDRSMRGLNTSLDNIGAKDDAADRARDMSYAGAAAGAGGSMMQSAANTDWGGGGGSSSDYIIREVPY